MRRHLWIGALVVACGAAPHPVETHDAGTRASYEDPPPLPSDRALASDATFGDLVTAAVRQDDRRASDSDSGCLVRSIGVGFVLEADLSVAVRGLPEAPSAIGDRLHGTNGRVRVLTRLGSYGTASPLVAVALTTLPGVSPRTGALLVQTHAGVYVLRTDAASETRPVDPAVAIAQLAALDVASVFVTADADVSLVDFVSLLAALPSSLDGRVAIAAMLPEDAQAPGEATDAAPEAAICDGLPVDEMAVGDLSTESLRASLGALVPAAQACVATSASGLGGVVRVAFRVGVDGHVSAACVREDATGDAILRACLVAAVSTLSFPAPTGGAVDVELPLRLEVERDAAHHQLAVCE
jgi:hypothetical protein